MKLRKTVIFRFFLVFLLFFMPSTGFSLPHIESYTPGEADFTVSGSTLTVDQHVSHLIVNYDLFSIYAGETVIFHQPDASSIALNRVTSSIPSEIMGTLTANGQIFLVNPNGIIFGSTSHVDAAGLVASTLDLSDADFYSGNYNFSGSSSQGIYHYGAIAINRAGGYAALLAPWIHNDGYVAAPLGSVVLAAGEQVTLGLDAGSIISVVIGQEVSRNLESFPAAVQNYGVIKADGGQVILTARVLDDVFDQAINNSGIIEAGSLGGHNGRVSLLADGDIIVAGNIDAQGDVMVMSQEGNVVHRLAWTDDYMLQGRVMTHGGNFQGYAGRDYWVRNGTIIDSGTGMLDLSAGHDVILGSASEDLLTLLVWDYQSGNRVDELTEFGYYQQGKSGLPVYTLFSKGEDIGRDGFALTSGQAAVYGEPEFYTHFGSFDITGGENHIYSQTKYNVDGCDHLVQDGDTQRWEGSFGLGDADFLDAVLFVRTDTAAIQDGPALSSLDTIFLTADQGAIVQNSGRVVSDNLALSANRGISGSGKEDPMNVEVNYLSAVNRGEHHIVVSNARSLEVPDLSALSGLNNGVTGQRGVVNQAPGGGVDLKANSGSGWAELILNEDVRASGGNIILEAEGDIRQNANIAIIDNAIPVAVPAPGNLNSPSHTPGVRYTDENTVEVVWQVEDPVFDREPGHLTVRAGKSFVMAPGTQTHTNHGNASITAHDDVVVSLIDASLGEVELTAVKGSIHDGDLGSQPNETDIIGHRIQLSADHGMVGGAGAGQEIDVKAPYDFSYHWVEGPGISPDAAADPGYAAAPGSDGHWKFSHTSDPLGESDHWWFVIASLVRGLMSEDRDLGPFVIGSDPAAGTARGYGEEYRPDQTVYYETLSPVQYFSMEPATPGGLYAYHPLTPVDRSALDEIQLDREAFEFIDAKIKKKLPEF